MGGFGSTRWGLYNRKTTVEECLTLDLVTLMRQGLLHPAHSGGGVLSWYAVNGERRHTANFVLDSDYSAYATLTLRYAVTRGYADPLHVTLDIPLVTTTPNYGGDRWWMLCPLAVDGLPCARRALTLHKPPGARYFGCRQCHNLTYTSAQEAHQFDSLYNSLAQSMHAVYPDLDGRDVERILNYTRRV